MAIGQKNFLTLESSNKKWTLYFVILFHFSRNLFLYYSTKVYIHETLEVKQNKVRKNLALHWNSLRGTAVKE